MTAYPDSAFAGVLEQTHDLPKTQILVLASTHLKALETFSPRLLDTLMGKLELYKPDVIAVENLSPKLVAMMAFEGGFYTERFLYRNRRAVCVQTARASRKSARRPRPRAPRCQRGRETVGG